MRSDGSLPVIVLSINQPKEGQPMTGSANEAVTTAGAPPETEPIGPKQLREFDAKLLQQLPDLSKEQMQHLIEHPEELRARLERHGFAWIEQVGAVFLMRDCHSGTSTQWPEFYAQEFEVDPDFSRIRLPDISVYTYVTPIYVAQRLSIESILDAIKNRGVKITFWDPYSIGKHAGAEAVKQLCAVTDAGRPEGNYIASFSTQIFEGAPRAIRDEGRYRGSCMTLREHLLWIARCLYCRDTLCGGRKIESAIRDLESCLGVFLLHGSTNSLENSLGKSPRVNFSKNKDGNFELDFSKGQLRECRVGDWRDEYTPLIRRVKLWRSLPQI